MDYRDERDALRGRVENLEQDLAGAREEIARDGGEDRRRRIAELEAEVAESRRLLERLSAELDDLRKPVARRSDRAPAGVPVRSSPVPALIGLGLVASLGVGLAGAALLRSKHAPMPMPVRAPAASLASTPPPPASDTALAREAPPAVVPPEPTVRHVTARWRASVKRATGRSIAAGSTCIVEAELTGDGRRVKIPALAVTCGGAAIYDSAAKLEGMSMSSGGVEEEAGDVAGTFSYGLQYEDKGPRSGPRTETSLNTLAGTGSVWSDSAPAFRVELALPYHTDEAPAEALLDTSTYVLRRTATVTGTDGAAPLAKGARCSVRVTPVAGGKCLARLRCGRDVLYGKGSMGVADCTVEDGRVATLSDASPTPQSGDPELDIKVAASTMELADVVSGRQWSVRYQLDGDK